MKLSSTENRPSLEEIDAELARLEHARGRTTTILWVVGALITVAASAVLIAMLWLPVLQIEGNSMAPVLQEGDLVLSVKGRNGVRRGDVIAFYYEDKVLVKRVIGVPGDEIIIDSDGNVDINGEHLNEPYLESKSADAGSTKYPVTVAEDSFFVLGDNRAISADSRSQRLGLVQRQQIIGKLLVQIWPPSGIELIN